ncbi:MAG: DAK2 domain-containing protein [Clostridia bacterium]|nr:DAK2 domain-containing protein [Clostridia bacterium]
MNTVCMTGLLFAEMVKSGAANLYANRTIVNDLNVFPIPDGDTGDNMYMTVDSGASAVGGEGKLCEAASKAARGMLMGARGNSGVILSRIFAGLAKGFDGKEEAGVTEVGAAFYAAVKEAYGAVAVPVEGTILTVIKDAANYAGERISAYKTLEEYFDDFTAELRRSLDRTPDLLDVLKEAGVVDSGGAGLVYIVEGMRDVLYGEGGSVSGTGSAPSASAAKNIDIATFTSDMQLEFGYCTEFLLRLQQSKCDVDAFDVDAFTAKLNELGNSVVCFRDDTVVKVHVHTMTPGEILDFGQQYGEFLTLKIENMMLQHHEATIRNRFTVSAPKPKKAYGIVAVASGDGIKQVFTSLGTDVVVDGGQSMNPSAKDFIEAFEEINASTILVYPNNSNVILTARQAAELYKDADVRVIPSRTIGEGYASLSMLDTTSGDTDSILENVDSIIDSVVTGMVSRASRDAEMDGVAVRKDDYIGFADDKIYVDSPDKCEALLGLAEKLDSASRDVMLLICGRDTTEEEAQSVYATLTERYKRTEVIMIDGGQPIHDFVLILE